MQIIGVWKYYLLNLWAINITVRQWQPLIKEKWMRTRLERSWGWNTLPGKVLQALRLWNEVATPFPDSLVILMMMLMILELRERRSWNPEHLTENVNSSQMCPSLPYWETGLEEGKGSPLQNCKITVYLPSSSTVHFLLFVHFLISLLPRLHPKASFFFIQAYLLHDAQVEENDQNLLLIKIHFPSVLLIPPVYAKENN